MTREEYLNEWKKDSHIEETKLAEESLNCLDLQSKYLTYWSLEKDKLNRMQTKFKKFEHLKISFYLHGVQSKKFIESDWTVTEHPGNVVIKANLKEYLEADDDYIITKNILDEQSLKVDILNNIVEQAKWRGSRITDAIMVYKIRVGA